MYVKFLTLWHKRSNAYYLRSVVTASATVYFYSLGTIDTARFGSEIELFITTLVVYVPVEDVFDAAYRSQWTQIFGGIGLRRLSPKKSRLIEKCNAILPTKSRLAPR